MRALHPGRPLRSRWRSIPFQATRYEIAEFGREAAGGEHPISACAAGPGRTTFARSPKRLGRRPPASRFSPDMSKHYAFGTDPSLKRENREFAKNL